MKSFIRIISAFLTVLMLVSGVPQIFAADSDERADYSISPEYTARYPHGVIEFYDAELKVTEGGETELKLIRMGGTAGRVTVEVKAIDVSAKYGVDYDVKIGFGKLKQDKEYKGTLIEDYLSESGDGYITSDKITTDEIYKQIIGYDEEASKLSDEEAADLSDASVGLISDTLGVTPKKAMELVGAKDEEEKNESGHYSSSLHELKDSVLGEKTAANGMNKSDMLDMDALIGNNDENLAASAINDAAVGASRTVTFESGENEKTIVIRTKDDGNFEPQEIFSLGLCNPAGEAELGEIINTAVIIEDNDAVQECAIGFESDSVNVGSDEAAASLDIVRTGCVNDYVEIRVDTVSGSADEDSDYLPVNTTAVFLPGEERKTVIIPLKTSVYDQTEQKSLDVVLSCESGNAKVKENTASVTIAPKKASKKIEINQAVKAARPANYGPAIVADIEKAKYNTDENTKDYVILFNSAEDIEDSLYQIAGVEIDVTQLDNNYICVKHGKDGDKAATDSVRFGKGNSGTIGKIIFMGAFYYNKYGTADTQYNSISINRASQNKGYGIIDFYPLNNKDTLKWDDVQIDEIRLYPNLMDFVFKPDHINPNSWNWHIKSASVQSEYRVFNGTEKENIISTKKINVGTVKLPDKVYRGWVVSEATYTQSAEMKKRKIYNWGYELYNYNSYSHRFSSITKRKGSTLTATDMKFLDSHYADSYLAEPIFRSDDMDYITVEQYNADFGALKIGGKAHNNENVKSTEWREGDELIMTVEPMHGYKCDNIEVTRADGTVENVNPGDPVMLTKGMKVKPVLCEENITVNVSWEYAFIGEYEDKAQNIANYSFTSDHAFTDNGDGTYTFDKMVPGDIVTMYLVPKNQNDTGVTLTKEFLETLEAGDHTFTLITDKDESALTLTVLTADTGEEYENEKYKVSNGIPAVWKKGDTKGLTITAKSNDETVVSVKIDGKNVDTPSYTAEKGFISDHTGWWLRTTKQGESRLSDDMRYIACVGDAYAFEVDDHDMTFSYYLIKKDPSVRGALITGRVVTNGGTIKRPSSVIVTSKNVDEVGVPVVGSTVSVLSNDPNDQLYENGTYYYPTATTDKNGYFTVYLPGYAAGGLGYCISISVNDRIYQNISSYQIKGTTVFQVPYQNLNFQIDKMTLGSDMNTTEIALLDSDVKIGVHTVIALGYRAQRLVFRSYNGDGTLIKEWEALPSTAEGWTYETTFQPKNYLREGGRLTVELYDQYGKGQGEYDTGYAMKAVPKTLSVTFPQFDPKQSVSLPIMGNMTSVYDLGSSSKAKPEDANKSKTDISSTGQSGEKNYLEITFGASTAIKSAVKEAKKNKNYKSMGAQARASLILSNIRTTKGDSTQIGKIDGKDPKPKDQPQTQEGAASGDTSGGTSGDSSEVESNENNRLENQSKVKSGEGKSSLEFNYVLGVYMSLYTQNGKCYFEDLTFYAKLSVSASATQQFYIYGVPVYLKMSGGLDGELLVHTDPKTGEPIETVGESYFNDKLAEQMQSAGVFHITIKYSIGTGLGNPKYLSAGISGSIAMDIDYQPWKEGAGMLSFSFDAEASILDIKIKYNIYKTSYGMFKSSGYTGPMDFSKVKNADQFVKKSSGKQKKLLSYRDANSETDIYGSMEQRRRARSLNESGSTLIPEGDNSAYNLVIAQLLLSDVTDTVTPVLMPVNDGEAALYLRLDDDSSRGDRDFSAVAYSIIDWDGIESEPEYLDRDNTFDSDLTAAEIGGGRILVVWGDRDVSYGDAETTDVGESLNRTDLSYCIFDKYGNPTEVKKLTDGNGCDRMPTIAYDEKTGKTFIAYVTTDYKTEGVTLDENNLQNLGDFLYNSYSTVCFKVLDENGDIITDYNAANESAYINYEQNNGKGKLGGMRYLNTETDKTKTQATIDELTAAALDGKVYVAYSLDTDRSTVTNEDRELCAVYCDLSDMYQSEPQKLTDDDSVDAHPQAVLYNGQLLLFWNDNNELACTDLSAFFDKTSGDDPYVDSLAPDMHDNAATSYFVTVQPDGKLCVIWTDWYEQDGTLYPSIYYREYDPQYKIPTGNEKEPYVYGSWGNVQKLVTMREDQDISETAYLDAGNKVMLAFKITNKDDEGQITTYDSFIAVLKEGNSVDLEFEASPEYALPGETMTLTVKAKNTGSLPSEKVTVKAELIDADKNETEIGKKVFEEHYQTDGVVVAVFDEFVCPEDPQNCKIRITAWENDMSDSAVIKEFDLPYKADIELCDVELNRLGENEYAVSSDIENNGNKALNGTLLIGFYEEDGEDGKKTFTTAAEGIDVSLDARETGHEVLFFTVPDGRFDEEGKCELDLIVIDGEDVTADQTITLHKPSDGDIKPADIRTNTENGELTVKEGEKASLEAAITPYNAQSGYRIIYKADDPNIASIDDSGNITAISAGQTVITVSAVKDQAYLFINSDGMISSYGQPLVIDDHGIITNMSSPDEQTPVLSKSISLTVTESGGSDSPATGEGIDLQLCIAIAITSLCCAAVIIIQIRKKARQK